MTGVDNVVEMLAVVDSEEKVVEMVAVGDSVVNCTEENADAVV